MVTGGGMMIRTRHYIEPTCPTVAKYVGEMNLIPYLKQIESQYHLIDGRWRSKNYGAFVSRSEVLRTLEDLTMAVVEISQRHGATAIRDVFRDAINQVDSEKYNISRDLEDAEDKVYSLEREIEYLQDQLKEANNRIAELERLEVA